MKSTILSFIISISLILLSSLLQMIPATAEAGGGGVSSLSGSTNSLPEAPKKLIRILNPVAAAKVLRLLRATNTGINLAQGNEDEDILIEDDNNLQKRQYDDYGHMRFGKRQSKGDFDDYGHLRFGK